METGATPVLRCWTRPSANLDRIVPVKRLEARSGKTKIDQRLLPPSSDCGIVFLKPKRSGRLRHVFASDHPEMMRVMKNRQDIQPDVLAWIGNDPHHQTHARLPNQFHHPAKFRRAIQPHGLQLAEIRQQMKVRRQISQLRRQVLPAALEILQPHLPAVTDMQHLLRFVRCDQQHGDHPSRLSIGIRANYLKGMGISREEREAHKGEGLLFKPAFLIFASLRQQFSRQTPDAALSFYGQPLWPNRPGKLFFDHEF